MNDDAPLSQRLAHWRQWIGRTEQREDIVAAAPLAGLAATLDRDEPAPVAGDEAPPLAHWLVFLPVTRQSGLGPDGHALRGGFLPPVPLPRRMWAGGRLDFLRPLHVGEAVTRRSRITRVDAKSGRSGMLVFVTVRHEVSGAAGLALTEEHDIVYRDAPAPGAAAPPPQPAPADEQFSRRIQPDPVLLFRYSALTFNGHRIHYDRRYVTEVEGYPGLVVHGPLIATLLVDLLRRERPAARLTRFAFTALRPTFDLHPFELCGRAQDDPPPSGEAPAAGGGTGAPAGSGRRFLLWSRDHHGLLTMRAEAATA